MSFPEDNIDNGRVSGVYLNTNFVDTDTRPLFNNLQTESLKGIQMLNSLSKYFFSKRNIETLQQTIRYKVYEYTNTIIDRQSEKELFVIMRSIYLQYGGVSYCNEDELFKNVRLLNNRVIKYAVNRIIGNLSQYNMYLNDISSMPIPLENPQYENKNNFTYDISNIISY